MVLDVNTALRHELVALVSIGGERANSMILVRPCETLAVG